MIYPRTFVDLYSELEKDEEFRLIKENFHKKHTDEIILNKDNVLDTLANIILIEFNWAIWEQYNYSVDYEKDLKILMSYIRERPLYASKKNNSGRELNGVTDAIKFRIIHDDKNNLKYKAESYLDALKKEIETLRGLEKDKLILTLNKVKQKDGILIYINNLNKEIDFIEVIELLFKKDIEYAKKSALINILTYSASFLEGILILNKKEYKNYLIANKFK